MPSAMALVFSTAPLKGVRNEGELDFAKVKT